MRNYMGTQTRKGKGYKTSVKVDRGFAGRVMLKRRWPDETGYPFTCFALLGL